MSYLQDEFRDRRDLRIRLIQKAGKLRSPDLEQDYDSSSRNLHSTQGILVVTPRREYYFPADWIENREFTRVQNQVREIRDTLES